MDSIKIDNKEVVIMNLVHYFVTEKNYNPVVVHGINDEIWLENMNSDYKIIRIVSKYIHNNEQLKFDRFRSKQITKKLKFKTFSLKMNVFNIYIDLGDNVTELKEDSKDLSVFVKSMGDIKNPLIVSAFPDIVEKTNHDEEGMQLLFKITDDINVSNEKNNKKMEKIFSAKKPLITYLLIILCIVMFVLTGGGYSDNHLINLLVNSFDLVKSGQVFRLFTSMFVHFGIFHLFFNMYTLYIVGTRVEDFFGKTKYLLIYLISGICGSLLSISFHPDAVSAGASGAIFGLFGSLLYFGYNYRGYIGAIVRSQILPLVIYNLLIGFFVSYIDVSAHIGGLIGGLFVSKMLGTIENKKYNLSDIALFLVYFIFLIYFALFR
ncbi:MAG: rhomboid family intramembrane serine protease [Bacilli bacterium]|nr:rhomboid family intramembrane serine protease [Bacilli bacterium]